MAEAPGEIDIKMDRDTLYLEEVFTDRRVGSIQRLTPVGADGQPDSSREVLFVGQTQLMTRAGPIPLSFEIPAQDLGAAVDGFADAANLAVEDTMKRLEEMRREAASSIIVPEAGAGPAGGMPPGGKIQMP
jgi:hypothetical protein